MICDCGSTEIANHYSRITNNKIPGMPSVLTTPVREALVADLRALVGDRATTNATQLEHHSHGESWHDHAPPDVVVFPANTDEVSELMKVAARHGAPVIPFGIGSSL